MRVNPVTLLPLTLWLVSSVAMATTVYKWVDAQGVTHYSDQPHPEAQAIDVQPVQTYHSPPAPPVSANPAATTPGARYTCELSRPENNEVFLNTSTVTARLRLEPQLGPGDTLTVAVDGKRVPNPTIGSDFIISNVERGTHTVTAVVHDRAGKQLCVAPTITFHVRQPSVQAPVKATRPKF